MCPKNYDDYLLHLGKSYLLDLITIVKYEAFYGINEYNKSLSEIPDEKITEFDKGYLIGYAHAYSRVISLMLQQAEVYNIPLSELSLDDIDPDKDLLPGI